ncbi:MAG: PorT family protein [Tannerellaceae bacterium]|nr:PorT family protein [Tannerellaceae bacterium]
MGGNDYATSPGGDIGNIENPDPGTDPDEEGEGILMTRAYKDIENELHPIDEYSSVRYSVPISVGFNVKKELTNRISIETGLIYTYLSSELMYRGSSRKESRLNLHYIGIPVNLVVGLWEQNSWEVYLSGGFTVEKGVRATLRQKEHFSDGIVHTTIRSGIPGVQ